MEKDIEGEVAIGVVRENGKFLLMRRSESNSSSGKWTFLGGRIEEEETVSDAVVREIREETGLDTELVRIGDSFLNEGELGLWKVYPVLLETSKDDETTIEMNHEHDKYEWIEIEQLDDFDTLGEMKAPEKLDLA